MTWTREEIAERITADTTALVARHRHWVDLDLPAVVELLASIARGGPDHYEAEYRHVQDLFYRCEVQHLGRTMH